MTTARWISSPVRPAIRRQCRLDSSDTSADLGKGQTMATLTAPPRRIVELRTELCHERQRVHIAVRTLDARRHQPDLGQTNGLSQTLNLIPAPPAYSRNLHAEPTNTCTNRPERPFLTATAALPGGRLGSDRRCLLHGTIEVSMAGKNIGDLLNAQNVTGMVSRRLQLDRQPTPTAATDATAIPPEQRATTPPTPITFSTRTIPVLRQHRQPQAPSPQL